MRRLTKLLSRLGLASGLTLLGVVAGVEGIARYQHLDGFQGDATGIFVDPTEALRDAPRALAKVDILPRGFRSTEGGFITEYGSCEAGHPGKTLLALGDSTTVMTRTPRGMQVDFVDTWPGLVAEDLGPGWRACVLAEVGFHPSDLAALARALVPEVRPDLTVAMLCSNDFSCQKPRHLADEGGHWVLRTPPLRFTVWRGHWNRWLFEHSEAYRYTQWRLAERHQAREQVEWIGDCTPPEDSLAELAELGARLFYLPPLQRDGEPVVDLAAIQGRSGVELPRLGLPAEPERSRRAPDDDIPLNHRGQRWGAERMIEALEPAAGR